MNRRTFLRSSVAASTGIVAGGALWPGSAPAFVPSGRPSLTHGVQSGEPRPTSALVWSRADRPSRLLVEVSPRPDFRGAHLVRGPIVTPDTDLTGRVALHHLEPGHRYCYRVRAESLDRPGLTSDFGWMGFKGGSPNNWNPWICSNWLTTALLMEQDEKRRQAAVRPSRRSADCRRQPDRRST